MSLRTRRVEVGGKTRKAEASERPALHVLRGFSLAYVIHGGWVALQPDMRLRLATRGPPINDSIT